MPENELAVRIAEYKVAREPNRLVAYGLGSCVGVTLYDRSVKVGGMAHVMLPSSRLVSGAPTPGKYADTAVEALLRDMVRLGASPSRLEAKLMGGATMFNSVNASAAPIGLRNVMAVREKLLEKKIQIFAEDVGGQKGRTVLLSMDTGRVLVRMFNQPEKWI